MKLIQYFSVKDLIVRFPFLVLSIALPLTLAIFPHRAANTKAVENPNNTQAPVPPGEGSPDETTGAGTRDGGYCENDNSTEGEPGFSVLMPVENQRIAQRPTFSLYIPETVAQKVFFSLKNAENDEEYDYQTIIKLPKTATGSEFSFPLPEDAPNLQPNTSYQWSISLICQQSLDPNDPTLTGIIESVES